jgi:hypothetical protein
MKGTNTGPFAGGPPTGQSVALPGADFITVEGNKISSVQGYFDQVRSEEEFNEVRERGRQVIQQMMQIPGFIGTTNVFVGRRLITTTAWEDAEAPKQLLRGGAHKEAMDRFFGTDFAAVGTTMVFVPDHINAMWMRCTACGQVANYDQSQGKCRCGQPLPEHPPYW